MNWAQKICGLGSKSQQDIGRQGEDAAAAFLQRAGFSLLARNWRHGRWELDIVCREKDTIVFVEVKTRSHNTYGGPIAAITRTKQHILCRAASAWLTTYHRWDTPCRFDVICALKQDDGYHLEHLRHAFDYTPFMDRGRTAWQP